MRRKAYVDGDASCPRFSHSLTNERHESDAKVTHSDTKLTVYRHIKSPHYTDSQRLTQI